MEEETSFGVWLHKQRRAMDLSRQALADQIGCAEVTLRRIEAGTLKPSKQLASLVLEKLGIPETELPQWISFARGLSGFRHPPSPSSNKSITNLPASLTSFIGREKEQADSIQLISEHRLLTLTGSGGVGKTRLSIKVGEQLLGKYADGLWLVDLAPLSDPALVPQAIVKTLGLMEQANRTSLPNLTDFLKTRTCLLILDNCEHLIQASAEIAEALLHSCPGLHILATSREALNIAGETIYRVPSLTTPDPLDTNFDTLSQYEAVRLFVGRAQRIVSDFDLTPDNASAVAQICHHLDGIPLAIELAAARVNILRVEEIAARLYDRFRLLINGSRTALPRHQTLRAMIDWSHELLTEPERILFRRLSIFAGNWTLEAAESVCADVGTDGSSPLTKKSILDLLTSLVNKSLVLVGRKQGQDIHYHMLETIRQYAQEKLWATGEGELMHQHHLAYIVDLAEHAEPNLRAFDMVLWLDRLETELNNIRVALEYALESDVEAELRLASALFWFWWLRYYRSEGIEWLERGLSIEETESGEQLRTIDRAMLRGKALNKSGFLILWIFDFAKAEARLEESLSLFRNLGHVGKQGMAYALLYSAHLPSNHHQSRELAKQSLTIFRELGDKFGVAECLAFLSDQPETEERLALSREIGDQDGIAGALLELANIAFAQDDYQRAVTLYEESLSGFRTVGNKGMVGLLLSHLGEAAQLLGKHELAEQRLIEALAILQLSGMKFAVAITLYRLGQLAWAKGDYSQAAQKYEEALHLFRETEKKDWFANTLFGLGKVAWAQGDAENAGKYYEEILSMGQLMKSKFTIAYGYYGLGKVAEMKGHYISARSHYISALQLQREAGDHQTIAYSLIALGVLAVNQKKPTIAAYLFGAVERLQELILFMMSPHERAEQNQAVIAARTALGEDAFTIAWNEGKKMSLDEVAAYALRED